MNGDKMAQGVSGQRQAKQSEVSTGAKRLWLWVVLRAVLHRMLASCFYEFFEDGIMARSARPVQIVVHTVQLERTMDAGEGTKAIGGTCIGLRWLPWKQVPRLGLVQELAVSTLSRPLIFRASSVVCCTNVY